MHGLEYKRHMHNILHPLLLIMVLLVSGVSADELKDPTRPGGFQLTAGDGIEAGEQFEQIVLQAIFYHPEKAGALINGRRYVVGDIVGNSEIIGIYAEKVVLTGDSGEITLKLVPSVITRHGDDASPAGKE